MAGEHVATGTFDITLTPDGATEAAVSGLAMAKTFHGGLDGQSAGRMLAVRTEQGSAGYVAMERFTGALDGRSGSFALQHSGTMTRGQAAASVAVIPDSGTDGLAGLTGSMVIDPSGGQHRYTFRYEVPE